MLKHNNVYHLVALEKALNNDQSFKGFVHE